MNSLTGQAQSYISKFDLGYQVSPIILQGGIAQQRFGSLQPIITFTGTPAGGNLPNLDQAFARYLPMPGSTLISQAIGSFPFANQVVAANATIQQPLTLSMLMICPVNQKSGYQQKLSILSGLQSSLQQHNALGGTYIIATPGFVYWNMLMTAMTDVTPPIEIDGNKQLQMQYQLDFVQPIVTQRGLQAAQSAMMQKITAGQKFNGTPPWSGNTSSSSASSPGNQSGVAGSLGNVGSALALFGASIQ